MIKRERLETVQSFVILLFVFLIIGLSFGSVWLAKNVYSYEVKTEEIVLEKYNYPTGEKINTFVCYTTTYGDCYHAEDCRYLWNSSHKTDVYTAQRQGFIACSMCSPTEKKTIEITETRYREVTKEKIEEKHPTALLFILGLIPLLAVFIPLLIFIKRKLKEAQNS